MDYFVSNFKTNWGLLEDHSFLHFALQNYNNFLIPAKKIAESSFFCDFLSHLYL